MGRGGVREVVIIVVGIAAMMLLVAWSVGQSNQVIQRGEADYDECVLNAPSAFDPAMALKQCQLDLWEAEDAYYWTP